MKPNQIAPSEHKVLKSVHAAPVSVPNLKIGSFLHYFKAWFLSPPLQCILVDTPLLNGYSN